MEEHSPVETHTGEPLSSIPELDGVICVQVKLGMHQYDSTGFDGPAGHFCCFRLRHQKIKTSFRVGVSQNAGMEWMQHTCACPHKQKHTKWKVADLGVIDSISLFERSSVINYCAVVYYWARCDRSKAGQNNLMVYCSNLYELGTVPRSYCAKDYAPNTSTVCAFGHLTVVFAPSLSENI